MRFRLPLFASMLLFILEVAHADPYRYTFTVTDISNGAGDFTLNIETDGLLTSTGMNALPKPLATPLGFSVTSFGENASGWYAFSGNRGNIYDTGLIYSDAFFDFIPDFASNGYNVAGSYSGSISGNDPNEFSAHANLTITDLTASASVTPEPSSLCLIGTGLMAGAMLTRRYRVA